MARQLVAVCLVLVIGVAGVIPPLLYSQDSATPLRLAWQSVASDGFTAVAGVDFDNDGDDDLAVGRRNLPTQLWRNDGVDAGGQPVFTLIWSSTTARETVALAWAVTSGSALLLAEATYDDVSVIYRVTPVGGGVTVTVQFTTQPLFAQTIVWGDIDSDSEPDLLIGGELEPIYYYLGATIIAGGPDTPLVAVPGSFTASSLALADMNGDTRPDLVVGLRGAPTSIFPGLPVAPFFNSAPIWIDNATNTNTRAVIVADFDGNGRDDLFIASVRENSRLYLHQSDAPFTLALSWVTDQRINAIAAAAADYNSDGRLDVALSSEPRSDVIQTLPVGEHLLQNNDAGGFTLVATLANRATNLSSIAWGQLVGGSTLDLAVVRFGAPARIYRNELSGAVAVA
uniref:FG-GAP repeat domain-containing protein n=1 Tax=Chloroflexus sp. TaxID=1904827 RepID=UPI002ACD9502